MLLLVFVLRLFDMLLLVFECIMKWLVFVLIRLFMLVKVLDRLVSVFWLCLVRF